MQDRTPKSAVSETEANTLNLNSQRVKAGNGFMYTYNPGGNSEKILITTPEAAMRVAEKYKSVGNPKYKDWETLATYMNKKLTM